jgi:hypothetical protein
MHDLSGHDLSSAGNDAGGSGHCTWKYWAKLQAQITSFPALMIIVTNPQNLLQEICGF